MSKVLAHKGCERRGDNPRGVYAYTKLYASANPEISETGEIVWETGAPWEGPLYAYELVCFDCDTTILLMEEVLELTDDVLAVSTTGTSFLSDS
jgi:hypothetical protein